MTKTDEITTSDVGSAMLTWYEVAIRDHPEGLISQAQAARILGVSRMVVGRLVSAGALRSVYFPKVPDISGIDVNDDNPMWRRIAGWLGISTGAKTESWPSACYVSFADVKKLWLLNGIQKKCSRDWLGILKGV